MPPSESFAGIESARAESIALNNQPQLAVAQPGESRLAVTDLNPRRNTPRHRNVHHRTEQQEDRDIAAEWRAKLAEQEEEPGSE